MAAARTDFIDEPSQVLVNSDILFVFGSVLSYVGGVLTGYCFG